jgi:hypothetical protein
VVAFPSGAALLDARGRLGAAPMKALFELLSGPAATAATVGARWRGLLVCAIDGTVMNVPDSPVNRRWWGKPAGNREAGYPQLRLVALVACGTRAVIDAVFGPQRVSENVYADQLVGALGPGMILLTDRGFDSTAFLAAVADTGAHLLARLKKNRRLPVLARHRDGSYLSRLGALPVRIIEAQITVTTPAGSHTGLYRLATTLLDPRTHPAADLIAVYHERWEIETAYLELKSTLIQGRILRSRTPHGITQEVWALLATYQILRTAITDAVDTRPGTDPDRASFTTALNTARNQLINAANTIAGTTIDLAGAIGRAVLTNLMPPRRPRTSPRTVKRALSRYAYRPPTQPKTSQPTTTSTTIGWTKPQPP